MKVFVIGIAGGTGSRLARTLKAGGDDVDGLYRRPEQEANLSASGVHGTLGDLVTMSESQLADAVRGSDVIVFTAGAGAGDKDAMTDAIDGHGVTKAIAAAESAGIKRLILVSVFPEASRAKRMDENFEHYMIVKKRADVELAATDLDWVIVRPAALIDDPGTGRVSLGPAQIHTEITRDDVATTIAELIRTPNVRRTILELSKGSTPIAEAVAAQAGG